MNSKIILLKGARKIYNVVISNNTTIRNWKMFSNKQYANELIYQYLIDEKSCMIARFGSTEMMNLVNYLGVINKDKNYIKYIKGEIPPWWWEQKAIHQLYNWSGVFPPDPLIVEKFCRLMINDIPQVDVLGSWLNDEKYFSNELKNVKRIVLEDMEPFFAPNPWTRALEGKKVLVIHPFAETIKKQYEKRELLFDNNLLPQFELKTIKAVQTIAGEKSQYKDWFEALDAMKLQIDDTDFDICIVGAGAYGFPLAAYVKKIGKKSIHLAGVTQLLFGIKGKRWENYIVWPYMNLFNEYWVRPSDNDKPIHANKVEGACYW